MNYNVNLTWDPEAAVWIATSEDIPGLVLESGSFDALVERVRFAAPELLELNGMSLPATLTFLSRRQERVVVQWPDMKSVCGSCSANWGASVLY